MTLTLPNASIMSTLLSLLLLDLCLCSLGGAFKELYQEICFSFGGPLYYIIYRGACLGKVLESFAITAIMG